MRRAAATCREPLDSRPSTVFLCVWPDPNTPNMLLSMVDQQTRTKFGERLEGLLRRASNNCGDKQATKELWPHCLQMPL